MERNSDPTNDASLVARLVRVPRQLWRDALSVYYANTPVWRWLKSGTLVFFGLFLWSASNLLLSNVPEWTWLYYVMAYGFVLILWGPLTHIVIVPLVIRVRRTAEHPVVRTVGRQASKLNLTVFFAIVLVLGTAPIAPMTLDFGSAIGSDSPDVNPDIECEASDDEITCLVEDLEAVDHVVVTSGDREVTRDDEPPYELTFRIDDLEEIVGQKQFTIEVRDADGERIQRQVHTVPAVRS